MNILPLHTDKVKEFPWQSQAVKDIVDLLSNGKLVNGMPVRGCLLRGGTGLGKMYIKALAVRELLFSDALPPQHAESVNPFPVLWLTPKSVRQQTLRVLQDCGIMHLVTVLSYGQIKNSDGTAMFLDYTTKIVNGAPEIVPVWNNIMLPRLLVCDECQVLKNPDSLQSKVVRYCPPEVKRIFASATPYQRVGDARTLIEGIGAVTKHNALPCSMVTAPAILREIASPKSLEDYSPSACDRLRNALEPYTVELKGVKFKFPTKTTCTTIYFTTDEQRREYLRAYEEYLRKLREARGMETSHGRMAALVAMQKFQQKAELLRVEQIAKRALDNQLKGRQIIVGSNYVETLRGVWRHLVKQLNVNHTRIAFVVGGQSERERQEQVDKFQRGEADYMLLTVRSGGVGISLHHDRDTTLPRHIILPPTWSAIDLVQTLGRGHRLTSISPTTQEILWFGDTVEDKVKERVEVKVKCISKSVTAKEQFMTLFENASEEDEEKRDEYNEIIEAGKEHGDEVDDVDSTEGQTGEGYDSVEELPTTYR